MTVKDAVMTLCFLGSILLTILGGWNYMKGRILLYEEKVKTDKMQTAGQPYYNAEEEIKKKTKERNNALVMFAAGMSGFFWVISYIYRRRNESIYPTYKTKQP